MSFLSAQVSTVKRSVGQNAIASAAYNSRSKLSLIVTDKETNISVNLDWDYSKKEGLTHSKIYAPEHAPDWVFDREVLWNKAEHAENRCDATTAGKIMLPLPNEFTTEQNIALLEEFVQELVSMGMVVDANIHEDNPDNKHAHLMATMRELVENRYGEIEFSQLKNRDWQGPEWVKFVRELHAQTVNKHYEMHGYDRRFCEKSYKELGIDLEPGVHEGPARNIKNAELVELNRQIAAENAEKIKAKPSIILDVLGMNSPVFTKEQIAKELDKRFHAGVDFTKVENIEQLQNELSATFTGLYEQILTCPEISLVVEADLKGRTLYTTTKRLELEERFTTNVEALHGSNRHSLNLKDSDLDHLSFSEKIGIKLREVATDVVTKINDHTGLDLDKPRQEVALSDEQRKAVLNILNGADISVLEGIPGAGKTTAMRELVRQYQKSGRVVIGVTPSSSASLELAKSTGIDCKNASLWRKNWVEAAGKEFELILRGDYYKEKLYQENGSQNVFGAVNSSSGLTKNHVMIIDEASMGELANMDYLINQARIVGAKVIKVGDRKQLSPVGWAGALDRTVAICGSEKLEESRRQINPLHQEATKLLGAYKVRSALDIFWQGGNIKVSATSAGANSQCIDEFVLQYIEQSKKFDRDDLVSIRTMAIGVFENKTRQLYNVKVREQLKEAGVIKGGEHKFHVGSINGEKQFLSLARGEQIVFTRNANKLGKKGIFNGEIGTILKVEAPDHEGHGVIDILVHKASGGREKVALDLKELVKSKWFNDGTVIDHGYGVTAHKLQGASIDHMFVAIEKGIGFEVFNVLATRHRLNVSFYTSKELLESVFYGALDESSDKAKNRFDITEEKADVILRGGLSKLVSKRINTSFAADYRTMGQTPGDIVIKDYIDRSQETITAVRMLTSWQAQEQRKSGTKPAMWDNKELWGDFKKARHRRAETAIIIKNDYDAHTDRLAQLNMNYATIEKHASQIKGKVQLDKVLVEQKSTILHEQDMFKDLVGSVATGASVSIRKSLNNVNLHIAETLVAIEEKNSLITAHDEQRQELLDAARGEKHFREILMPEYLSRIYHTFKGASQDAGIEALEIYQDLAIKHGHDSATNMVVAKPTLLGDIKGWGLGSLVAFTNDRKDATELVKNLGRQLGAFNESKNMERVFNEKLEQGDFGTKIFALTEEIEHLRSLLPADIDKEFIEVVEEKLKQHKVTSNNIDWRELQNSKLFDSIRVAQISKVHKEILTEHGGAEEVLKPLETVSKIEVSRPEQKQDVPIRFKQEKPSLTFAQVKDGLNQSVVAEIFRQYAPHLNPDGKIQKRANQISSGSLNMDLGNKLGLWKRFSDGSKGDIFSFIQEATGCSKSESLEIVASHVGISSSSKVANFNQHQLKQAASLEEQTQNPEPKNEWVTQGLVPAEAPVFDAKTDLAFLSKKGSKVVEHYEYKNKDNQLLGYTVRIEDELGKKQVLPVAYCHNEATEESRWMLKGFTDNGTKPIYGLSKLAENEFKPVLIVEGEKTANIAQNLLPDHVVISWMGGAQSVDRVDWVKLAGGVLTIWPDNDTTGVEAAKNIAEHIDNHNGFNGLVTIVDTKALNLTAKWDLADELPRHLAMEQLPSIVDNATNSHSQAIDSVNHKVLNQEVVSQEQQCRDIILDSVDMLVETNRIDKDEYTSKEMYHDTMIAIAKVKNIDLAKSENFIEDIRKMQDEYRAKRKNYTLHAHADSNSSATANSSVNTSTKEQTINDLVRDTCVLHQVQLGVNQLTNTHREHIENAAKEEVAKMRQFGVSDREHAGSNMYKAITSNNWLETLANKNQQQTNAIKLKFTAKTIDEFLEDKSPSSKTSHEHLAQLRKYGIDEHAILKSFKTDHALGAEHLASIHNQLTMAENFATKYKAIIDEARQWGYSHNDIASTRSIIGMDERAGIDRLKEIRNAQLFKHIEDKFNSPEYSKPISKLDQMKERLLEQQNFLKETYESLKSPQNLWSYGKGADLLLSGQHLCQNPNELSHLFKLADEIVEKNIMAEYVLCRDLGTTNHLAVLVGQAERTIDYYNCSTIPERLSQMRQDAKCVESAFAAIEKEQDTLADMHGNIKKLDIYSELLAKAELSHEQRQNGDLAKLKLVAETTLSTGTKDESSIIKELQQTTDLKETHKKLDQEIEAHHINSSLEAITKEKQEAKTPDQVIDSLKKEQEFLAQLHGNLKYPERDLNITARAKLANELKQENLAYGDLHESLKSLTKTALSTGTKDESSIIKELQQTTDLKETHKKLDQGIEAHHINSNLEAITKEKQEAKTSDQVIDSLKKEQGFLTQLHSTLKYPEYHGQAFSLSIQNAMKNEHDNVIGQLHKLSSYVQSQDYKTHDQITKILKDTTDPMETHKSLFKDYQDQFIKNIHKNLSRLDDGGTVKIDNHIMSCPLKFMDYVVKTRTNEFIPHHEIQQIHNQVTQQQKHLEMEKDMGGYGM